MGQVHPSVAARLGILDREVVRVRSPRGDMELPAFVVPTIRPDTLFIPFHYGEEHAVNQLTNPAVEPSVKIPEYKMCAATIEKITGPAHRGGGARENFTAASNPKMFPYAVGETKPTAPKRSEVVND